MKNSQFHFFLIFLIVGFSALGVVSYRSIDFNFDSQVSANTLSSEVTPQTLPEISAPLVEEVVTTPTIEAPAQSATVPSSATPPPAEPQLSKERADLVAALERLIKDDIRMKIGSKGSRVGTVQKVIALYEGKKLTIDNAYGEGLQKSVKAFQTAVGDQADGLADPGTYQKMIDWLKKSE